MSARKRFDRELFEKYDKAAREATSNHLRTQGYKVMEHPDRYAQDLLFYRSSDDWENPNICLKAECEVKIIWSGTEFPYDSVQLPQRKEKFFDGLTQFFIWNKDLDTAVTFWDNDIKDLTPVEVPNKYIAKGEYFYQIPMERVEIVSANI